MKKLIIFLLSLVFCISLCACGSQTKSAAEKAQEAYEADLRALDRANERLQEAQENLNDVNQLLDGLK